jgi:hypothetical protein
VATQPAMCASGCTALEPATLQRCSTQGMASAGYSMLQVRGGVIDRACVRWEGGSGAVPFTPSLHLNGL